MVPTSGTWTALQCHGCHQDRNPIFANHYIELLGCCMFEGTLELCDIIAYLGEIAIGIASCQEPLHTDAELVHGDWKSVGISSAVLALAAACLLDGMPVPAT